MPSRRSRPVFWAKAFSEDPLEPRPGHEEHSVQLGSALWEQVLQARRLPALAQEERGGDSTIHVAIEYPRHTSSGRGRHTAKWPTLVCKAACARAWPASEDGSRSQEENFVLVPPALAKHLGLFPRSTRLAASTIKFQLHEPILLCSLVLTTGNSSIIGDVEAGKLGLEDALQGRLIRQGENLTLGFGSHGEAIFQVIMTEPVLQGVFAANTNITLTYSSASVLGIDDPSISQDGVSEASNISALDNHGSTAEDHDGADEEEDEDVVIDESFLSQQLGGLDIEGASFLTPTQPKSAEVNSERSLASARGKATPFHTVLLESQEPVQEAYIVWKEANTEESEEDLDEESVILLEEGSLATMGSFDGDWMLASLAGKDGASSPKKLVRVFASRTQNLSGASGVGPSRLIRHAFLSPVLYRNLHRGDSNNVGPASSRQILLFSLPPLTARARGKAPVPFAESLTVGRVASPISIDKNYQTLFLDSLRSYFQGRRRVVRKGDVIAVSLDGRKVRWIHKGDAAEGKEQHGGGEQASSGPGEQDIAAFDLPAAQSQGAALLPTAVVYFQVISIVADLDPLQSDEFAGEEQLGFQSMAWTGELGCVVDSNLSKMVQTGVSNIRVPDATSWLGVQVDSPPLPAAGALTDEGSPYAKLVNLVQATLLPRSAAFGLHLTVLLKGARGCGKRTVVRWVAQHLGVHLLEIDCFELVSDTETRTEGTLRARFDKAAECAPGILLLRNIEALARKAQAMETGQEPHMTSVLTNCIKELRERTSLAGKKGKRAVALPLPVAVFATTSDPDKSPVGVLGCFKHEISFEAPNEAERLEIIQTALGATALSPDVSLKSLATQTAALVASDLSNLAARAKAAAIERLLKAIPRIFSETRLQAAGITLCAADLEAALGKARSNYSESIGAPKIPNVTWDDVGGLASVKNDILDTIQLPLEHPELFSDGLKKRSGILLYGPPGTGKTLLAKAVATSCSLNFFSVKGPELLNMYIGESEANVRRVFQRARDAMPCVIFFDELDSVAPKRGNQGDSGGVMDRIVSQLLAELDGMTGSKEGTDVFVIGATNRPDLLDPALLRPGRFDRLLYLSVAETHGAQLNILQALTRKFKLDPDLGDLRVVAEQCPFNLTGADFYALCSDAMLKAMTRKASEVDAKIAELNARPAPYEHPYPLTPQYYLAELAKPGDCEVWVNKSDFEAALRELVPSVSAQEMEHYRQVRLKFETPENKDTSGFGEGGDELKQMRRHLQDKLSGMGYSIQDGPMPAPVDGGTSLSAGAACSELVTPQPLLLVNGESHAPSKTSGATEHKNKSKGNGKGKARTID
ncbi:AAA-domain-containing protein [Tilletiaria anomala UBC 951]|uniref:Peroxisomal ATPase PEX6 n=1 Tax=Tilletiaria anomala (strain ATCC 24038 / CBS 436.72 / UBC 951) TaxID=1037660 RepID=A0A066VUG3_TILAU|nr:AAA-domain-containing protein [Tilletiaria anomala UBC 951]KDN42210.1 AAA-domain-containing protein [Tilletiaria anomala UBC 951]